MLQTRASNPQPIRSNRRTWPHWKLRGNVPNVDGALTAPPMICSVPPAVQRVGIVNVRHRRTTGQRRRYQRQQRVARIRPTRRISQVNMAVHQFTQSEMMG